MRALYALRGAFAMLAVVALLAPASTALAGGFYLMPRGTLSLGRGGAYVAGVEDPHALFYNPAGMSYSGNQFLADATLSFFEGTFTRIDSGGNTLAPATGYHAYFPIPTLGGTFTLDEVPDVTFGATFLAPNSVLAEWPGGADAPQRYSLLSLEGSLISSVAIGAAYRPIPELSLGLSAHLITGAFAATVALSACDGVVCSFPEDPEYDAVANISLPVVYPFFALGGILELDIVKIGLSVSTPFNLEGRAQVRVRPPAAAEFAGAEIVNRRSSCNWQDPADPCRDRTVARSRLEFPWVVRLGVEVRPVEALRVELAAVYESWSVQDEALIDPTDVWIENALGGLEYQVGPLSIPRNMNDTVSVRLGGTYTFERIVTARLGLMYENGAFSDAYLTPLTLDSDKVLFSGGLGIDVSPEVSLDVVGGYLWMASRSVRNSAVPQANPIRPPTSEADAVYVGNGDYTMGAPFLGIGMRWRPDGNGAATSENEAEDAPSDAPENGEGIAPESDDGSPEGDTETEGAGAPESVETEASERPWYLSPDAD